MLINFNDYPEARKRREAKKFLYRSDREIDCPELAQSFLWLLKRIESGECELVTPESFREFPYDGNRYLAEWMEYLDDENYICAIFKNPQIFSEMFYARSLRPSETSIKEKAFMIEPAEAILTFINICRTHGATAAMNLEKNANSLANG